VSSNDNNNRISPPLADWEHDLLGPQTSDGRYWHKRAEAAEAKLEKVREWLDDWFADAGVEASKELRAILDPVPPFTLPTEAGARFTAVDHDGTTATFLTYTAGEKVLYQREDTGRLVNAKSLMQPAYFTDHRLIGADE
jgi:hypothetical protein